MTRMHIEGLQAAWDAALIEGMTPGLKAALDVALARGLPARDILARVRRRTGGPRSRRGGLTYLAVEAYLEAHGRAP